MSTDTAPPPDDPDAPASDMDLVAQLQAYYREHIVEFFENPNQLGGLGMTLADTQREVLEAVENGHSKLLVVSGNGTGKTAVATMLAYWHFQTHALSWTMLTSGNYDILTDMSYPFLTKLHRTGQDVGWFGETKLSPPKLESEQYEEWKLRYISPKYPENLEGRHAPDIMVVIEECEKPDVTAEHIDSATSSGGDVDDISVAIANPPQDKSNVVYDMMQPESTWHTIQYSSFDSHNVKRDLGELPDDDDRGKIPGLWTLSKVKEKWHEYNRREWPGADVARRTHPDFHPGEETWNDLHPKWYRRVLGKLPPKGASIARPWLEQHVDLAVERWRDAFDELPAAVTREAMGMDFARGGGDRSAINEIVPPDAHGVPDVAVMRTVLEEAVIDDHEQNFDWGLEAYDRGPLEGWFWLDAVGEGSGTADRLRKELPGAKRFKASESAANDEEYYKKRTEAYVHLGIRLKGDLAIPPGSSLEKELREGARALRSEERNLSSETVVEVKGKDDLKERLGRSPDVLDAAALAAYSPRDRHDYDHRAARIGGVTDA